MRKEAQTALLSLSLVLSGCAPDTQPKPIEQSRPAIASIAPTGEAVKPASNPLSAELLDRYTSTFYPELKGTKPNESGRFATDKGTPIVWLNYTDGRFNEEAAKTMFSYMQDITLNATDLRASKTVNYKGRSETFLLNARPSDKERVIFIVSENTDFPSYTGADPRSLTWMEAQNGKASVSFVKYKGASGDKDFSQRDDGVGLFIAIEACSQATVVDSSNKELAEKIEKQWCISVGTMYASRQKGLTYQEFEGKYGGVRITGDLAFLTFDESLYNLSLIHI